MSTLIFGYGNYDRQDDGVAWHVLKDVRQRLNIPDPDKIADEIESEDDIAFVFQLQLTPELAEEISRFERVCFVDAHTGSIPDEVHVENITPLFQHSPLTHHLTPNSLLSIIEVIYNKAPESILVSIRGYEFQFSQTLSNRTAPLVPQASSIIYNWLKDTH